MIRLIASDMDGTLINDKGVIDENIFDLIYSLNKKNIKFAAASGRFYSQLSENFKNVNVEMLFIAHNGALVKYNKNGDTIYSNSIPIENIKNVLKLDTSYGEQVFLAGANEAHIVNPSSEMIYVFNKYKIPFIIHNSYDEVDDPIYKITYFNSKGVNDKSLEYLNSNLDRDLEFVVSGDRWIDILNKDVCKGNAIKIIQNKYNISEKNTMAFGDYYNDLTMFKVAHYSYAMKNAPEDVKKHARFVTESNNNNGVYNILYKYAATI